MSGRFGWNLMMDQVVISATANGVYAGQIIDKRQQNYPASGKLFVYTGPATGAPTSVGVVAKIMESANDGETWTDALHEAIDPMITSNIGANQGAFIHGVNVSSLQLLFRPVVTVTFTGGTSPAIPISLGILLGDMSVSPTFPAGNR